jgi:hypothetical protein
MSGIVQHLYVKANPPISGGTQFLSRRPEMFLPDQWPSYYRRARDREGWALDGNPTPTITGGPGVMEAVQRTFISSTSWTERLGLAVALENKRIEEHLHGPVAHIGFRMLT